MKTSGIITSFEEAQKLFSKIRQRRIPGVIGMEPHRQEYYRGQASDEWHLRPGITRNKTTKEMISNSTKNGKPCIFITDDRKADWWLSDKSKNIYMPLPELRKEFKELTNSLFYSYQPFSFLEIVKSELKIEIEPEVIREVKELLYKSDEDEFVEVFIIRQRNSGDIDNLEKALVQLGYQLQIVQNRHNVYNIIVFFPMIPDIKRMFVKKLKELTEYYELEILDGDVF